MRTMTTRGPDAAPPTLLVALDLSKTQWKLACRVSPAYPPRVRTILAQRGRYILDKPTHTSSHPASR